MTTERKIEILEDARKAISIGYSSFFCSALIHSSWEEGIPIDLLMRRLGLMKYKPKKLAGLSAWFDYDQRSKRLEILDELIAELKLKSTNQ